MAERQSYLAFDLGAESGRAVLGILDQGRLELQELRRFPNTPCLAGGRLHWDILHLFAEMKAGLAEAARAEPNLTGIGVDTWGVDFGLLDSRGDLLGNPVHYRDARTNGIFQKAFGIVPREAIFEQTGIQFLQFNTLFQLLAMRLESSPLLDAAEGLLMIPDLLNYWFTGRAAQEFTNATTTQCYDTRKREWAWTLLEAFGIPRRLFREVSPAGSILGETSGAICAELDIPSIPVVLPATHDTGSAVAAVPAQGENWAYISCGTWALVGAETTAPVVNAKALEYNFTNEGGAFGSNRLLTNVMGLWLLQQSRRAWAKAGKDYNYDEIASASRDARPFAAWIDPDDELFFNPSDMIRAIAVYCRRTGQTPPESVGEIARVILESLALKYRYKIEQIEELTGRRVETIHLVGGGSRNAMLAQATADACGRRVLAGPAEATAMGNALLQASAMGMFGSLVEIRSVARQSSSIQVYDPARGDRWMEKYQVLASYLRSDARESSQRKAS